MIQIHTFPNPQQAAIAQGMLENEGIKCQTSPQSALSSIFPTPDGSNFGGVALYVEESQAQKAVELLRRHGDM